MPKIGIGTSINFYKGGGIPFKSDLLMRSTGRSGLAMVDEFGNNIPILPAYLYKFSSNIIPYVYDNGALDIASNPVLTLNSWIKGEASTISTEAHVLGKPVQTNRNGMYYIAAKTTATGAFYKVYLVSSGGAISITSNVVATDLAWHMHTVKIDRVNSTLEYFIDKVQQGVTTSFTGTVSALGNAYAFLFGKANITAGSGFLTGGFSGSYSDTYVFPLLLSSTQMETLFDRGHIDGALVYYPFLGTVNGYEWNAAANNLHLTIQSLTVNKQTYKFSSFGSRYGLDKGYTRYQSGLGDIYIPYLENGLPITSPPVLSDWSFVSNHPGNLTKHNLANTMFAMVGDLWDRSNATIWGVDARSTESFYDATSAATKKYWHSSNLNNILFQAWANAGYKGKPFVKITDHSYKSRLVLEELFEYTTDHFTTGYSSIVTSYCKDYDVSETNVYEDDSIYWKVDTAKIITARGLKVLKHVGNDIMLSLDGGLTYPHVKTVTGNTIVWGRIFADGKITFAAGTKGTDPLMYYSTDNLATVHYSTVTGIDGNPFVETTLCYHTAHTYDYPVVDGVEMAVIGCYDNNVAATQYVNINAFYTVDGGQNYKVCFKEGVTLPAIAFRHFHGITWCAELGVFKFRTGDGTNEIHEFNGAYNTGTDTWTIDGLITDNANPQSAITNGSYYKSGGLTFIGTNALWASDSDDTLRYGIYKVPTAELATQANYVRIYNIGNQAAELMPTDGGEVISQSGIRLHYSKDNGVTFKSSKLFGLPANLGLICGEPYRTNGWIMEHIRAGVNDPFTTDGVVWIKLK